MPVYATLYLIPVTLIIMRLGFYKGLPIILLCTTGLYYAILGYMYWWNVEGGYFAGLYWGDSLEESAELFTMAILITSCSYYLTSRQIHSPEKLSSRTMPTNFPVKPHELKSFRAFTMLSIISCAFVFIDKDSRGSLFLIAYQFSDLAIPAIIFALALSPNDKKYRTAAVFFLFYCIFVGFRYKIILLSFPLLVLVLANSKPAKRFLVLTIFPALLIILFSIIQVTRVKFSGLDLSQIKNIDTDKLLYGLFADTNILFGVSSITSYILPNEKLIYFQPFLDSVLELIPKIIIQDRDTGQQIYFVLEGLISNEGMNSATTYPFFGEYLNMFGYPGYWAGCILLGFLIAYLMKKSYQKGIPQLTWTTAGIIAVLFGYYYVSRGYMPQFVKSLVFILTPYYIMTYEARKKHLSKLKLVMRKQS